MIKVIGVIKECVKYIKKYDCDNKNHSPVPLLGENYC